MPVLLGSDSRGRFARWGKHGKKYRYPANHRDLRELAKAKAAAQGRAVKARGGDSGDYIWEPPPKVIRKPPAKMPAYIPVSEAEKERFRRLQSMYGEYNNPPPKEFASANNPFGN